MKKDTVYAVGAGGTILLLWWLYERSHPKPQPANAAQESGALPVDWLSPMGNTYAANAGTFGPQSLDININNPLASTLTDKYMPMFGFVGVAQGQMYE